MSDDPEITIDEISAEDAYPLRRTVLRAGTISRDVTFPGDPSGLHLGAFDEQGLIGIASWLPVAPDVLAEAWHLTGEPLADAAQLRGMATDPIRRHKGVGAALLNAGIDRLRTRRAAFVVANARTDALGFYLRFGFEPVGAIYADPVTGLDHRRIRLDLR